MVLHVEIHRVLQMQLDTQMHKSRHVRVLNYIINIVKPLASRDQCAEYVENSNIKVSDLLDVALRIAFF